MARYRFGGWVLGKAMEISIFKYIFDFLGFYNTDPLRLMANTLIVTSFPLCPARTGWQDLTFGTWF